MDKPDLETAMRDPGDVFRHPDDVLASEFSDEQKRKILLSWEDQMTKRQIATEEGMGKDLSRDAPGELLQAVANALHTLGGGA